LTQMIGTPIVQSTKRFKKYLVVIADRRRRSTRHRDSGGVSESLRRGRRQYRKGGYS
jgi:hypothetical protein